MRKQFLGCLGAYGLRYVPKNKATGDGGCLELNPEEVSVVKQIYRWVDQEGLSGKKVIARLNARGIPPRKGGAVWQSSSVMKILRNEIYAGVWYYNKREGCEPVNPIKKGYRRSTKTSLRRRPRTDWIPVVLPKELHIIGRDQWERVQKQLDRNRVISPRNTKHPYLLRGLVRCGGCGSVYAGTPCHARFYYRCIARCKTYPTITEHILDQTVWAVVREAIFNPNLILHQLKNINDRKQRSIAIARDESLEVDRLIERSGKRGIAHIGSIQTGNFVTRTVVTGDAKAACPEDSIGVEKGRAISGGPVAAVSPSIYRGVLQGCGNGHGFAQR